MHCVLYFQIENNYINSSKESVTLILRLVNIWIESALNFGPFGLDTRKRKPFRNYYNTRILFNFSGLLVETAWWYPASLDLRSDHIQQRLPFSNLPRAAEWLEIANPIPTTVRSGHLRVPGLNQSSTSQTNAPCCNWWVTAPILALTTLLPHHNGVNKFV